MSLKIFGFLIILSVSVVCDDPVPLLPRKFTEAFRYINKDDDSYNYNGKLWLEFDSSDNFAGFRIDLLNSKFCDDRLPNVKNCKFIGLPGKSYVFSPEESICELDDTII